MRQMPPVRLARMVTDIRGLRWRLIGWGVFCVLALGALISSSLSPYQVDVAVGQVAPRDIESPRDFIDRPTTEKNRREAAAKVMPSYVRDPSVAVQVDQAVAGLFVRLRSLRDRALGWDPKVAATSLREQLGVIADEAAALALVEADDKTIDAMEKDVREILRREMSRNIAEGDLATFQKEAIAEVRMLNYPRSLADFLVAVVQTHLRPNFFIDNAQTEQQRQAAMNAVPPAVIVKGEVIVRKGERIGPDTITRLRDAGVLRDGPDWDGMAGSFVVAAMLVILAGGALRFLRPSVYARESSMVLAGVVVIGVALLGRALWPVSPYLAPIGAATMLLTILLDPIVALIAAMVLSLLAGLTSGHHIGSAFVGLAGGLTGILTVRRANQRSDIMRAGVIVGLANMAAILGFRLLLGDVDVAREELIRDLAAGAANGLLLAGVLTIGSLPYFESIFGILTTMKLLELSNPNQPLLRRLLLEAPGTYHHSLLVANLAEAGAEVVGANGLLARVGSYYHDIGKIKRPYFFIENQAGGRNPHDKLTPHLSALIVMAHVKDGVELAQQYKLPSEVVRFIPEHHGTTLISYFYQRALEGQGGKDGVRYASEESFRHVGPRPQSKETAIVMLADAAEAAVRAQGRNAPGRIQATVKRIIRERLEDGQLDQCDLTLRDLDRLAEVFTHILCGVYHARIDYPDSQREALPPGKGAVSGLLPDGGRGVAAEGGGGHGGRGGSVAGSVQLI